VTDEAKKASTPWWVFASLVAFVLFAVAGEMGKHFYPHYYGPTAEDIANVALNQTPKGVARALPCTDLHRVNVTTELRHSVVGFESAAFFWRESPDQVSGISLHAEEHEESKNKKEGSSAPRALAGKLDELLPGVKDDGEREWGARQVYRTDYGRSLVRGEGVSEQSHAQSALRDASRSRAAGPRRRRVRHSADGLEAGARGHARRGLPARGDRDGRSAGPAAKHGQRAQREAAGRSRRARRHSRSD